MRFLCRRLMSERGEASQTALAQEIIITYKAMDPEQRRAFFEMLCNEYSRRTKLPSFARQRTTSGRPARDTLAALSSAVEPPRQELFRRINTAPGGTETLVALREHLLQLSSNGARLRRPRRRPQAPVSILVQSRIPAPGAHQLANLCADPRKADPLRIRARDQRLAGPAPASRSATGAASRSFIPRSPTSRSSLSRSRFRNGLTGDLEPLLDVNAPVLPPEKANTAIFYSINNCLPGLRNIPFGIS